MKQKQTLRNEARVYEEKPKSQQKEAAHDRTQQKRVDNLRDRTLSSEDAMILGR